MDQRLTEGIKLEEQSRTYYFPDGDIVRLDGVVELKVSESGNHRVKTADGKLHIIPAIWHHIEIETKSGEWTV